MESVQEILDNITSIMQDVCREVCDDLCRYRETADDDFVCDYIREHGECPLDRLQ